VRIVGAAVSLECGEHREHGVGRRERPRVVRGGCDGERPAGIATARFGVAAEPVRRATPGEEQRDVARLTLVGGPVVRRDRLVEPPAEMTEQAHPPCQPGREPLCLACRAVEAAERLVPVPAHLKGLARQLLDCR
jgi:hypothetical protein